MRTVWIRLESISYLCSTLMCVNVSLIEFRDLHRKKRKRTTFNYRSFEAINVLNGNYIISERRTHTHCSCVCLSIEHFPIFTLFNQSTSVPSLRFRDIDSFQFQIRSRKGSHFVCFVPRMFLCVRERFIIGKKVQSWYFMCCAQCALHPKCIPNSLQSKMHFNSFNMQSGYNVFFVHFVIVSILFCPMIKTA